MNDCHLSIHTLAPFLTSVFGKLQKKIPAKNIAAFFVSINRLLLSCTTFKCSDFNLWVAWPSTVDCFHTSQNSFNKWTKISNLEIIVFELKNDGKKWSKIYFEIHRAPLEIPAKLPGQFCHSGQIFLHWAAATLKGLGEFQNKKSRPRFTIIFK